MNAKKYNNNTTQMVVVVAIVLIPCPNVDLEVYSIILGALDIKSLETTLC
jgi:hypothetical protein